MVRPGSRGEARPDSEGCSTREGAPVERWVAWVPGRNRPPPTPWREKAAEAAARSLGPPVGPSQIPVGEPDPMPYGGIRHRCCLL